MRRRSSVNGCSFFEEMKDIPITAIKGIGPKRAELFEQFGVRSARGLLNCLPRDYLDYSFVTPVCELTDGKSAAVQVRIASAPKYFRRGGMSVVSVSAQDDTGGVTLKWFNQPYRYAQVKAGDVVYACGRAQRKRSATLVNPAVSDTLPGILSVYTTIKGLNQRAWRDAQQAALEALWDDIDETLPASLRERYHLVPLALALRHAHFPISAEALGLARTRLDFENALLYFIAVEEQKAERTRQNGFAFDTGGVLERYCEKLPYEPTGAQKRVMDEIAADMRKAVPMNRLLQGDVGSGKTAVAIYALCVASANGKQGALLAPTEILAEQHYESLRHIFGDAAVLLTGGMKKAQRDAALRRIADGTALCVTGTHALLSGDVRFYDLGCVVTDEQHRFGVRQRAAMLEKGARPDILVMSATPIPRTLALILYGDLDISVIDELPPGRKPVKTSVIPAGKRADMYAYLAKQAGEGVQSYVVCPLIEESENIGCPSVNTLYAELKKALPKTKIGMLHGRMREQEKTRAMQDFRDGETGILVATSVVEVGVHVPNACNMVIEGAERFGLSQLHQLRGRVGRSAKQAYCFLLYGTKPKGENERMKTLTSTCDGFAIAQKDLILRGPGDFIGVRQHGESGIAALGGAMDVRLLEQAGKAAREIAATPSDESARLIELANERFESMADIAMN
ncbi:MAG TPA: ATP-dependent DNA helicase RecG [Eubacteriales bacterium]|nr:ATP-dependent DNA helicase RecG [Eubacteriales bacterium]